MSYDMMKGITAIIIKKYIVVTCYSTRHIPTTMVDSMHVAAIALCACARSQTPNNLLRLALDLFGICRSHWSAFVSWGVLSAQLGCYILFCVVHVRLKVWSVQVWMGMHINVDEARSRIPPRIPLPPGSSLWPVYLSLWSISSPGTSSPHGTSPHPVQPLVRKHSFLHIPVSVLCLYRIYLYIGRDMYIYIFVHM